MTMGETHDVVIEELAKLPDMEPQVIGLYLTQGV